MGRFWPYFWGLGFPSNPRHYTPISNRKAGAPKQVARSLYGYTITVVPSLFNNCVLLSVHSCFNSQILTASSPLQWYFSPVPHLFGVGFNSRASLVLQLSRSWCFLSGFTRSSWPRAPACIVIVITRFCCEFVRLRSGFNPCFSSLFPRCSRC